MGSVQGSIKLLLLMPTKYIGNMVLAMKAISAILDHIAPENVVLVLDEEFRELGPLAFGADRRFLFYPRKKLKQGSLRSKASCYLSFIRQLRTEKFGQVLDLDGTVVSARLCRMSRSSQKIGPDFTKRPKSYTKLVNIRQKNQHCIDDFADMARYAGVTDYQPGYLQLPKAGSLEPIASRLSAPASPLKPNALVCIHPGGTKDYKLWDINKFAELADWLLGKGWNVIIIGNGDNEKQRVDTMLAAMTRKPVNAHGRLSLLELTTLLQHTNLYIGNDSGPMHLAITTVPRVIALFGPTEIHRWAPKSKNAQIVQGKLACSPNCEPENCCNNYQCLESLSVKQVISEAGLEQKSKMNQYNKTVITN